MIHRGRLGQRCAALSALLCLIGLAAACAAPAESQEQDPSRDVVSSHMEGSPASTLESREREVFESSAESVIDPGEDPAGSSMLALTEADCDSQHIECFRRCWTAKPPWPITKGNAGHYKYCQSKCLKEYLACLAEAGIVRAFAGLGQARFWLAQNPRIAVGTLVLVAGVVYVVSTGGAGALILLPAAV